MNIGAFIRVLAVLPFLLSCAGCGGIRTSGSVSPATFLLPGLLQTDPKVEQVAPIAQTSNPGDRPEARN